MPKTRSRPKVRGVLLQSRLAFVRQHAGSAFEIVLGRLRPRDAAVLRGSINSDAWHDQALLECLDHAIVDAFDDHERADVLVHLGRAAADAMLGRCAELGLTQGTPGAFLEAVPRLHARFYADCRCEFRFEGIGAGLIRVRRGGVIAAEECWHDLGWIQRGLELCGASAASVTETSCSARRGSPCEFYSEWEPLGEDR